MIESLSCQFDCVYLTCKEEGSLVQNITREGFDKDVYEVLFMVTFRM